MKCGIVILNYNDFNMTSNLLEMIKEYDSLDKIIVVDNHSTDGSYEKILEYKSDKIEVLRALSNGGYSKGNNIGIKYVLNNTDIDIIGIANSDVEFKRAFIERIKKQFEERDDYAIISGLQISPEGNVANHPFWPEYTTKQYFRMKLLSFHLVKHFLKPKWYQNYLMRKLGCENSFFRVGAVEGSLFFIRRKDIELTGLLDENIFIYYEEDILAKKIKSIGRKIGVDSSACYIHYGAGTTQKVFSSKTKINHKFYSSVYFFNKYQSDNKMLQILNFLICEFLRVEEMILLSIKGLHEKK